MMRAHPRSRGEHLFLINCSSDGMGSSPLARGTPSVEGMANTPRGLIPARAGNTLGFITRTARVGAHPRSRGEHVVQRVPVSYRRGSSPLARGTHKPLTGEQWSSGLIPARAGNTFDAYHPASRHGAHPRSRGEHGSCRRPAGLSVGSSPLARGTPRTRHGGRYPPGLIPARAGNTLADMGLYPLHQQNRITLKPEPTSRIHDK